MRIVSQLGARVALYGLLVLALAFAGNAPGHRCAPDPAFAACECGTMETVTGPERESEGARAVDPAPVGHAASPERKSVAPAASAETVSYTSVGNGIGGRPGHRATAATPMPLYVRHCSLLC